MSLLPLTLEILPEISNSRFQISNPKDPNDDLESDEPNPECATIHNARKVPVYRKLGAFQTKRLREIVYSVLENLDPGSVNDPLPDGLLSEE